MPDVTLWGSLRDLTEDGRNTVTVEGETIYEILQNLGRDHPKLKPLIDKGVTVSLDGTVYRQDWFRPVKPDSEVFILPRMAGG